MSSRGIMVSRRREPPKVVRQLVLWVPENRHVALPDDAHPYRVWTLYGEGRNDPKTQPALPITPFHNHGAFMEDYVHDWNVHWDRKTGKHYLHYASRVMAHSCWILVEYADNNPFGGK
jgi:hypothetical protein